MMFQVIDADHLRWVQLHGVKVTEYDSKVWADFPIKCKKLIKGKCSIYEQRPDLCRRYYCDKFL
jgi:Fe-S-cluster containining protein